MLQRASNQSPLEWLKSVSGWDDLDAQRQRRESDTQQWIFVEQLEISPIDVSVTIALSSALVSSASDSMAGLGGTWVTSGLLGQILRLQGFQLINV